MIIHIAGSSGAGKTTLGKKLKKHFGNKIVVRDLDDIRDKFKKYHLRKNTSFQSFKKNFKKNYQNFLDNYIKKYKKPIIITGINTYINNEYFEYKHHLWHAKYKLNTHTNYKFCINISPNETLKQRWYREYDMYMKYICKDLKKSKERLYNVYAKNKNVTIGDINEDFKWIFSYSLHKKHIKNWNTFYKNEGYDFLTRKEIFKVCKKIIKKNIKI